MIFIKWTFNWITNSIDPNPCWEANSYLVSQEIPSLLWNPNFQYRAHKSPPWSQSWTRWIKFTSSHPIFLRSNLILSSHLRLGFPSCIFRWDTPIKIPCAFLILQLSHAHRCTQWTFLMTEEIQTNSEPLRIVHRAVLQTSPVRESQLPHPSIWESSGTPK
jgi:hypothetical protein